ncbi:MAG: ATP-binding protein [bacterium]
MIKMVAKINPWGSSFEVHGLKRKKYMEKIIPFLGSNLIKVLTGQRRSGKSHLMRSMIKHLIEYENHQPKNFLYINMELRECAGINTPEKLFLLIDQYKKELKPDKSWFIFIDEVQEIEHWEKALSSLIGDPNDSAQIFVSGSNANLLAGELATYIGGRYVSFEIFPFSYTEFLEISNKSAQQSSFIEYMNFGGMPEIFHLPDEERKKHYIRNLFDSIVFRDVIKRHNIRDVWLLEQLAFLLADMVGGLFSLRKILNTLNSMGIKSNLETIGNYISFFKQAFYIHEAERYNIKGRKILSGEKKYYLNDPSFKKYLSSSFDPTPGKYLENAIFLHLKREGYDVRIGQLNTGEIDFVAFKGNEIIYVQSCYLLSSESIIEREFGNLEKIQDNYQKFVISLDFMSFGNKNGIIHLPAWEFVH